ncbi:DUF262 domain-containing protein [Flavobacterium rhamnosiphilum]|uniref:DUF262 domain-containing protein n=1 Tax=Flavobacterium rhamnosiphilum TaxID=2541724 RepID=A0A4R5FAK3_9FLAO|nr:DUF262 domain-containing protein [Flavobacterium rhamnosiphilum]TDE45878.1 DUF262 domain-containing protein [Flavobacterium rhamnosiphilum]
MAKLIDVEERDINYIFGNPRPYSLDVYQRDYRWSDDKEYKIVTQLIIDIELRFENNLKLNKRNQSSELPNILKDVDENFKPYFLNTIMLNQQGSNIYIVDGQQRLTTILLLLIKLYHIGIDKGEAVLNVKKFIGEKIYEEDMASVKHFKISNVDRNTIIKKIFEEETILDADITNITQLNLKDNYQIISKYYDGYFYDKNGSFNAVKYNYYVYNLLQKVLIIEQVIKHKEDVAMIFETANDRGKELEPHEVLKGMLLGVLDTDKKEECNVIWNDGLKTFFNIDENYKNVDDFFRTYFRAKYADTAFQYQQFANKYHRNLLSNDKIIKDLDRSNPSKIEKFIKNDFKYFYKLYLQISAHAKNGTNINIASNYANEQGQQFLLILSALTLNDPEHDAKINLVAKKFDQFFTISSLISAGDNNKRQKLYYDLNKAIRNKPLVEINDAFDSVTIPYFNENNFSITVFNDIFQYKNFEKAKIDGRFSKYVLSRVDRYLADLLNEQSFAKQESLHFITHSGNRPTHGFHIEHMFSNNEKIMDQFKDGKGEFDEKLFIEERNRLGAVILFKGNENIRTSNWIFKKKLKSYQQSGFIWNRILTNSVNQASLNNCTHDIKKHFKSYEPDTDGLLTREAINERQELLFRIISEIYSN